MIDRFATTGIGSLPHTDRRVGCELVLNHVDIPFWPQFPKNSFLEGMVAQFSEGFPFVKIDAKKERIWIEHGERDALDRFYEAVGSAAGDPCALAFLLSAALSEQYAPGFFGMRDMARESNKRFDVFKGQITGPLTFTLGLKDETGKAIYYDEELRELALVHLVSKAAWQVKALKEFAGELIIFIDEPILSALGSSAYLGVSSGESAQLLERCIKDIKTTGAITAIHCCGKTDWDMIFDLRPDVINFDAYAYFDSIAMYHERIGEYLSSGGYLAWGMVPTTNDILAETPESIQKKFIERFRSLSGRLAPSLRTLLASRTLFTPSCGTASLATPEAEKVFAILKGLKAFALANVDG
ncbi:MAG: hypothetical protein HQK89_07465 [Nitrospirae bacterium]|nr:hypothetical protein [Nitrospirota bacterium]